MEVNAEKTRLRTVTYNPRTSKVMKDHKILEQLMTLNTGNENIYTINNRHKMNRQGNTK